MTTTVAAKLTARAVKTPADIEHVRVIRNSGLDTVAGASQPTEPAEQQRYWRDQEGKLRAWLYETRYGVVVGYSALRRDEDGRLWVSQFVLPEHRGQGYCTQMLRHIVRQTTEDVWSRIRVDNAAALRVVDKAGGWQDVARSVGGGQMPGVLTFVSRGVNRRG